MPRLPAPSAAPLLVPLLLLGAACEEVVSPPDAGVVDEPRITTPRWAFEPWISKDISDGPDTYAFVEGFRERDIPVGVVVLDSPWETNYNTFVVNEARYPDFAKMVQDLRDDDIRLVLWTTQMINSESFDLEPGGDTYDGPAENLAEAARNDYLVNDGETYFWWKGYGAGLDFFNDDAVRWWRAQQDPLLEMGVAGWKLDFGEEYIPGPMVKTAKGEVTRQAYSEAYYRDFWEHGVKTRGADEFVTMVRPWDESYGFPGRFFARKEHAPVGWVGDQFRDWEGLSDALDHIFRSARAGYVVLGSDIGGYLDRNGTTPIPFDVTNFHRWTAMSGLMPFFQLHGRANLAPWTVEERAEDTVAYYRYWATLHHELVPFFYSLAEEAYENGGPILHPQGEEADWPGDYRFVVGDAFLVAPILNEGDARDVELPAGARWLDFWDLASEPLEGGQLLEDVTMPSTREIPVYVKEGAIVPMHVDNDVTGFGNAASAGYLTLFAFPGEQATRFRLHEEDDVVTEIELDASGLRLSRAREPVLALVVLAGAPASVTLDGAPLEAHADRAAFDDATRGYFVEPDGKRVWLKAPASAAAIELGWSR